MRVLHVRNVNEALYDGLCLLHTDGRYTPSRGGAVLEIAGPVATVYICPQERVLFHPVRDANPFFHLFEALWILAGHQDVAFLAQFNENMRRFSDNGKTFHAPYGFRLRKHFHDGEGPIDQLGRVVRMLTASPGSRQAVLQIWDATMDLGATSKDIPCNDLIMLSVREDALNMMVCCRSNDLLWGTYGANAVQFSMLLEYLAARIGVVMGTLTQLSWSYHAYCERADWPKMVDQMKFHKNSFDAADLYLHSDVLPVRLVHDHLTFDTELERFLADPLDELGEMAAGDMRSWNNRFFALVALPMYQAFVAHKRDNTGLRVLHEDSYDIDWLEAGRQWLARREA